MSATDSPRRPTLLPSPNHVVRHRQLCQPPIPLLAFALALLVTGFTAAIHAQANARSSRSQFVSVYVVLEGDPAVTLAFPGRNRAALASAASRTQARTLQIQAQHAALQSRLDGLGARVTGRFTRLANALRVRVPNDRLDALRALPGVRRLDPVRLYTQHLGSSLAFIRAPEAWSTLPAGLDGRGLRIGIIDSGIDYTHATFGGSGRVEDYDRNDPTRIEPGTFPTLKVVGGFDFAGDDYNPAEDAHEMPQPDLDPLDCRANGHGTHVAGIAAGFGVLANGTTYQGSYSTNLALDTFAVAPGVAPGAQLYALKIFGCEGSTWLVTEALEWAADPNGDGDFSDRLDVVNLSLGGAFGTLDPEEADIAAVNRLVQLGCVVVCSAGNSENIFYVVSAPGVADRAISVANVIDQGKGDALAVTAPAAIAGNYYFVEAAITPSLTNSGPISGQLVYYEPNLACDPPVNAAALRGNIALIDRGTCFFSDKIRNAQAAGAVAVVMVNNQDSAPIPMGGDGEGIRIPAGMIAKADGALLKAQLAAGVTVRLDASLSVERAEFVATLDDSSSRGPGSPSALLKPDLAAPGVDILSAKAGSGTTSVSLTGTSMSSPAVAGAAALLRQLHPEWTPETIKAALMNSARPLTDPKGVPYPESRMGAGRLDIAAALRTPATLQAADPLGRVGLSFGTLNPITLVMSHRSVVLTNHTDVPLTYAIRLSNSVEQAGINLALASRSLMVPPHAAATFDLLFAAEPALFDFTIDGTTEPTIGAGTLLPRHYLYETSGQLWLEAADHAIHLPYYVNLRPASTYQATTPTLRPAPNTSTNLNPSVEIRFAGKAPSPAIPLLLSAFQLGESSPNRHLDNPNRALGDLLAVGAATDFQAQRTIDGTFVYFGIAAAGNWTTPQSALVQFDVLIDRDGDGEEDFVLYNDNAAATNSAGGLDVFMTVVLELTANFRIAATNAVAYVNYYAGDEAETALFNNSVLVLPTPAAAIGLTREDSSFHYKVLTYTPSGSVDRTSWIPFDAARPILDTTVASPDATPFHDDGAPLRVRLDREAAHLAGQRLPRLLVLHHFGDADRRFDIVTLDLDADDTDHDGMPDWWEQRAFGGTATAGPGTDNDHDGIPDLEEFRAGTNPQDGASSFKMLSATRASRNNISVRWSGIAGQLYALERSTNLTEGFTQVIRDNVEATPPLNSITDTNAPDPGPYFYRVRLKP